MVCHGPSAALANGRLTLFGDQEHRPIVKSTDRVHGAIGIIHSSVDWDVLLIVYLRYLRTCAGCGNEQRKALKTEVFTNQSTSIISVSAHGVLVYKTDMYSSFKGYRSFLGFK